ncbi:MAG TPA: lysoplasmalogenase family protein, partial [Saprospiraceae bacterium]|nr:lysoplasmalogenase family protein [Saprospiraceae bacterium]
MTNSNYSRNTNLFKSVFLAIVVIYLTALVSGFESLTFAMKPLLLLPLLLLVVSSKGIVGKTLLVLALCFSWAGDTLLLLVYKSSIFFLLGLAAFMLAHILYIVLFRLKAPYKAISTKWNVALLSLIGLY